MASTTYIQSLFLLAKGLINGKQAPVAMVTPPPGYLGVPTTYFNFAALLSMGIGLPSIGGVIIVLLAILLWLVSYVTRVARGNQDVLKNGSQPVHIRLLPWDPLLNIRSFLSHVPGAYETRLMKVLSTRHSELGGTFSAGTLGTSHIFTIDPENIKTVLSVRCQDYIVPPSEIPILSDTTSENSGLNRAHFRRRLRPHFINDPVIDLKATNSRVQGLLEMVPTSGAVDLQPLFLHYTLDTATYFIFGRSTDALSGNDSDAYDEFRKAFSFILEQTGHPSQTLPLRSGTQIKMAEEFRTCRDYIERSTEEALSLHGCPRGEFTSDDEEKLSSSWSSLSAQQEGSQERNSDSLVGKLACLSSDKETLHYELLNLLISTRDSIANLLSSLFIEIVRRPDVWAKLRDEVGQVKGQEPDYEQLRDLKYARSCVNEALRLHPPVLSNTRIAVRDTVLPRGGGPLGEAPINVSKGCAITYSAFAMHRRKDLFGEDAAQFCPERWLHSRFGWEYLPFGGGPHICLGQQYALTETTLVLVRFVQHFVSIESRDAEPGTQSAMGSKNGVKVSFSR